MMQKIKFWLLSALKQITKEILEQNQPIVIGITGNVGKTTTREMLVGFLGEYTTIGSNIGNYNSDLGVCLSIIGCEKPGKNIIKWLKIFWKGWRMTQKPGDDFPSVWVLELGIDHPGDMDYFVDDFLKFDIVIFGFVGEYPVHTENFGSRESLIHEKSKILRGLKPEGTLIVNGDDPFIKHIYHKRQNVIKVGFSDECNIQASDFFSSIKMTSDEAQARDNFSQLVPVGGFKINFKNNIIPFKFEYLFAKQQAYNLLPIIAIGVMDGINMIEISEKIKKVKPIPGRLRCLEGVKDSLLIDDSYNAAPSSVFSALDVLESFKIPEARIIAAIGEMKELGEFNEEVHRKVGQRAAEIVDILIGVGDSTRYMLEEFQLVSPDKIYHYFQTSEEAADWLKKQVGPQDIILIKGSQASRMEKVSAEILANKRFRYDVLPRQSQEWLERL